MQVQYGAIGVDEPPAPARRCLIMQVQYGAIGVDESPAPARRCLIMQVQYGAIGVDEPPAPACHCLIMQVQFSYIHLRIHVLHLDVMRCFNVHCINSKSSTLGVIKT